MKEFPFVLLLASICFCLAGCGASGEQPAENSNASRAASTGPNSSLDSVRAPGADQPSANNAASTPGSAATPVPGSPQDLKGRKMEMLRGPVDMKGATSAPPKPMTRPAPDNSEYSVFLADTAVELRTFKNHPQLLKVEKRSDGKQSLIKIYLKDGRVLDIPGEKIESLATAPAASILGAAGLQQAGAARRPTKAKSDAGNLQ